MLSLSAECFCGEGPGRCPELIGRAETGSAERSRYRLDVGTAVGEAELLGLAEPVETVAPVPPVEPADAAATGGRALPPVADALAAEVGVEDPLSPRRVGVGAAERVAVTEGTGRAPTGEGDDVADGETDGDAEAVGCAAGTTRTGSGAPAPDSSNGVITAAATASASPPPTAVRRRRRRAAPRRIASNAPGGGSSTTGPGPSSPASRSSRSSSGSSMGVIKVSPKPAAQ